MISLLQLQYFCALAEGGTLTETAKKRFVSQSTLSAAITKLEGDLGVALFDREKGKLRLNRAGQVYLQHIRAALGELDRGWAEARRIRDRQDRHIALAASHSVIWKDFARDFRRDHPDVCIQFKSEDLGSYHQRLLDGSLDFVITGSEDLAEKDLSSVELNTSRLCLCVSPDSPLAARKSITLKEIEAQPYIGLAEGLSFRIFTDRLFEQAGVKIDRVLECESVARPGFVRSGEGVAITPSQKDIFRPYAGLPAIPISDPCAQRTIALYWKRGRAFSPLLEEFYARVCAWLKD